MGISRTTDIFVNVAFNFIFDEHCRGTSANEIILDHNDASFTGVSPDVIVYLV